MRYLVDYLETRGYVERRADPSDRRASLIFLTERGWDQVRAALATIARIEEEWARSLGTRDMVELRKHLARLNHTIGQAVSHRDQ
jgi:DNA-binding MarR family transcriptional regulator